jgi:hypothetical protein
MAARLAAPLAPSKVANHNDGASDRVVELIECFSVQCGAQLLVYLLPHLLLLMAPVPPCYRSLHGTGPSLLQVLQHVFIDPCISLSKLKLVPLNVEKATCLVLPPRGEAGKLIVSTGCMLVKVS